MPKKRRTRKPRTDAQIVRDMRALWYSIAHDVVPVGAATISGSFAREITIDRAIDEIPELRAKSPAERYALAEEALPHSEYE